MTRKDYVLIAGALREAGDESKLVYHDEPDAGVEKAAHAIAYALSTDNPRFDRARFLRACGVEG